MKIAVVVLFVGLAAVALAKPEGWNDIKVVGKTPALKIHWMHSDGVICADGSNADGVANAVCPGGSAKVVPNPYAANELEFGMTWPCAGGEKSLGECNDFQPGPLCDSVVTVEC